MAFLRLEKGSPFRWEWGGGFHADGQVEEVEPERTLQLSYRVPAFHECVMHPTRVRFESPPAARRPIPRSATRGSSSRRAGILTSLAIGRVGDVDLKKLRSWVEEERSIGPVLRLELAVEDNAHFARLAARLTDGLLGGEGAEMAPNREGRLGYRIVHGARRARVDVLREGDRVVITETFEGEEEVDDDNEYERWEAILEGFGPIESGTPYDY